MQFTLLPFVASGLLFFATSNVGAIDFSASCSDWYMDGTVLFATCNAADGTATSTALDMNDCITNEGGSLACAVVGDYSSSCTDCAIESGTADLLCDCENGTGGDPASILDLSEFTLAYLLKLPSVTVFADSCVSNNNGSLACGF
ncbi:Cyanovirin-N [Leucogyrophana mollusca]|uniref:Cyanovirin-N n=1 Tax=Leucogyrophana mollusca TaxID=85980 RepID=A0ACB8BVN6_9AGAM|nr:Cyanovirin-N [Leucogyrophana mollusca]